MKNITVLGIDLAKNVFQLHGTDSKGKITLKKRLGREGLIEFMAQLPSCLIGIEAYGGSHMSTAPIIHDIINCFFKLIFKMSKTYHCCYL